MSPVAATTSLPLKSVRERTQSTSKGRDRVNTQRGAPQSSGGQ